jgi:hypothetical protein
MSLRLNDVEVGSPPAMLNLQVLELLNFTCQLESPLQPILDLFNTTPDVEHLVLEYEETALRVDRSLELVQCTTIHLPRMYYLRLKHLTTTSMRKLLWVLPRP